MPTTHYIRAARRPSDPLANLTTAELLRLADDSHDPLARALADRLEEADPQAVSGETLTTITNDRS